MADERTQAFGAAMTITHAERRLVMVFALVIVLVFAVGGFLGTRQLQTYADEAASLRQARVESLTSRTAPVPGAGLAPAGKPVDLKVALRMNRIGEFALKESAWTADFNLAFRWTGSGVATAEAFRIVNGQVLERDKQESVDLDGQRYERFRVLARMTKPFDSTRFPFGDEGLVVQVEDATHGPQLLRYVADERNSVVDPEGVPRSIRIDRILAVARDQRPGASPSPGGLDPIEDQAHSQFYFAMVAVPAGLSLYLKLFQALFASVALSLVALHIKVISVDCRFGLPVGGFFAAVTNNVFVADLLPVSDRLTLSDMTNTAGLLTIFIIVVQSVISLYLFDNLGRERLSQFFDRVCFAVLVPAYVTVSVALPLAAMP